MKRINKLLIFSLIMVFGLLFQAKVFAGETSKNGEFTIQCLKSVDGQTSPLSGCSYKIYKVVDNTRVEVDSLTTGTSLNYDITVEVVKDKTNEFVIVEDSTPSGYTLTGDSERTIIFTWNDDDNNTIFYPSDIKFVHTPTVQTLPTVTLLSMNKPANQGGTIYANHYLSIRNTSNTILNICAFTQNSEEQIIEYSENGSPCRWPSNGTPVRMVGFPTGTTYVFYDETSNNSSKTFTYTDGSTVAIYYDTTDPGNTGVQRSVIYLTVLGLSVLIAASILIYMIYVNKKKSDSNKA